MKKGPNNAITDVKGVRVGHCTLDKGDIQTGVTVVMPSDDNPFVNRLVAASYVINGFGKASGLVQIDELGWLESPIALTNTLSVGAVQDALVGYMLERCETEGVEVTSLNVVVGECNDGRINAIRKRAVGEKHLRQAISEASVDFAQGSVGAGRGMVCHGLKGGIGSASRCVEIGGEAFTVGVLVQANHGRMEDLTVRGRAVGAELKEQLNRSETVERGSVMVILATDLPVDARQLRRMCKRAGAGLARTGTFFGHGSGDIVIGFTTANRLASSHGGSQSIDTDCWQTARTLKEGLMDRPFQAVADATEEAVLNALEYAHALGGFMALNDVWRDKQRSSAED